MKSFIERFKSFIRFIVTIFASREFGFMYCLLGTFAQVTHTYFLTESISSFSGGFRTFQAILLSAFISSSLLYFVAIADNTEGKESRRIHLAINIFAFIEIVINFYYYSRHLIIDSAQMQIFDFIFAILVSCLIPITIKLYGGLIKAREWMSEISNKKETEYKNNVETKEVEIQNKEPEQQTEKFVEELIDLSDTPKVEEYKNSEDTNVVKELYIQQQIELAINKRINEFKELAENQEIPEESINTIIDKKFESIKDLLTEQILEKFETKQEIFMRQFTNKCKAIIKNISGK
jgi:hypothetical protein